MLKRISLVAVVAGAAVLASLTGNAQTEPYRVVPNWMKIPANLHVGKKDGYLPFRQREAAARAAGAQNEEQGQLEGPGVSGIAIDDQDRIYNFNRNPKTVMVFDRDGNVVMSGGDGVYNGKPMDPSGLHSGEIDWQGNIWVVDRAQHRVLKFDPKMEKLLMQLGTTAEKGVDEKHFDTPSGVSITRKGDIIVTDGYGNNRVVLFDKDGKFIKQVGKGKGGPTDTGRGNGEWDLPHQAAIDASDTVYIVDRENHRIQVFDNQLNYIRQFTNAGWNPWDIAISRKGTDGFGYVADHVERVHKVRLSDGEIVATWGKPGRGPGEFDWVHGMAVDSQGAVYTAETYGQRIQKFVPATGATAAAR